MSNETTIMPAEKMQKYLQMYQKYLEEGGFTFYTERHIPYLQKLLHLIETRDMELMKILNYGNWFSRKVFTMESGIKLERADYKTAEILKDYIGRDKIKAYEDAIANEKKAAIAAKEAAKKAEFDALNAQYHGFLAGKPPLRIGNIRNALDNRHRFSGTYSGIYSVKDFIELLISNNDCRPEIVQEPRYKEVSRRRYNNMSWEAQREYERRMEEGGMIDVYYVSDYKLGKTAYEYALFRIQSE